MPRTLRYKVFNKDWKMMVEPQDIISFGVYEGEICDVKFVIKCTNGETQIQDWEDTNDLVFLQSTGLTDRNGKEIYEGDIVQKNAKRPLHSGSNNLSCLMPMQVIWGLGYKWQLMTKNGTTHGLGLIFTNPGVFEVIGSIYTHPHLLTPSL